MYSSRCGLRYAGGQRARAVFGAGQLGKGRHAMTLPRLVITVKLTSTHLAVMRVRLSTAGRIWLWPAVPAARRYAAAGFCCGPVIWPEVAVAYAARQVRSAAR